MKNRARDPHDVLGVAEGAEIDEIKKQFRARAKALHPDTSDGTASEDAFHELRGFPEGAGCGVIVSSVPKPSNAVFSVRDPAEVLVFLNSIADLAERGETKSLNTSATIQGGG